MSQAPKPTQLFDIEKWYKEPEIWYEGRVVSSKDKKAKLKETIAYGKPYALAKSIKRMEELKNHPKGTFFKLPKHKPT